MKGNLGHVRTWGVAFVAAFGTFWTLADPLGGMDYVTRVLSTKQSAYISIGLFGALCATVAVVARWTRDSDHRSGLTVFGETRMALNYPEIVGRCRTRFMVIGLSLPSFSSEGMLRSYDRAIANGASIDITLLNPMSPSFLQRDSHLYQGHEPPHLTAARSLRILLQHRAALPAEISARFSVHIVNMLPTVAAVIADDLCYWHPYLLSSTGVVSPYLRESVEFGFGRIVSDYVHSMIGPQRSFEATLDSEVLASYVANDQQVRFRHSAETVRAVRKELSL